MCFESLLCVDNMQTYAQNGKLGLMTGQKNLQHPQKQAHTGANRVAIH